MLVSDLLVLLQMFPPDAEVLVAKITELGNTYDVNLQDVELEDGCVILHTTALEARRS